MKRLLSRLVLLLLALVLLAALCGCAGEESKRVVKCDRCGKDIYVPASSNFTDDWIMFCEDCAKEIEPVIEERVYND